MARTFTKIGKEIELAVLAGGPDPSSNLRLRLLTGSTDDEKARHSIGLMKDAASSTPGHARMVLYHDQGGMPEYYSMVTYASIPLDSIKADTLTIVVKTYNGEVNRTFKLRSSDSSVVL